ncbi:MAG: NADPH:quinone reductase [Chthoniobacterales bacterium]|nr:NADPH:quinone reductase [Chthoniobacterales bacterium]
MKAIRVEEFGEPGVMELVEVPMLEPGPGQVLVRVEAAGVNPVETYIRAGTYARKPALPFTPGNDGAGVIETTGAGVKAFSEGDRVYLAGSNSGTYAEYCLCGVAQVHCLPEAASFAQGAAMGTPYATAYRGLLQRGAAQPNETVLVHGASGGVGTAAVQLALAHGMRVFGTAGTKRGRELVREQGAHEVFDHHASDYLAKIKDASGGSGIDVILEMLANVNLGNDLTLLAPRGRVVVIGNRGRVEIDARQIMVKDLSVFGLALWGIPADDVRRAHAAIIAGLESGALNPVVGTEMPLRDAAKAHQQVMEPGAKGKIVLIP